MVPLVTIPIHLILVILFIHWIADFVCQTDRVATNKSKDWSVLSEHALIYGIVFFVPIVVMAHLSDTMNPYMAMMFVAANVAMHFAIDAITSRMTSYFWQKGRRHDFFVVIGADQFLHTSLLLVTAAHMLV